MSTTKRKLKNGKTVFDVRVQYGKMRPSRTVPGTKTEAKRVESRLLQDLINGRFEILETKKNPKFKGYAERYKRSVTWQKSYERTLISVNHLVEFFGNKRLTEITSQDFIDYRTNRLNTVGVATTNRERTCLLRMLNLAVQSDDFQLTKNAIQKIKALKEPPAKNRTLSLKEYHSLLEVAPKYFKMILIFACESGLRRNEILNLKFEQIIFKQGRCEIELVETKSQQKEYVPVNKKIIKLFEEIASVRNIDLYKPNDDEKQQFVFLSLIGNRLKSVRKPMIKTFKLAGIQLKPFHTFRHFWTTMMFEAGADPVTIQKVGRWHDFETMLRYCYTTRRQEHDAVNQLGERLDKK